MVQTYSEPYNEEAISLYHRMDGLSEELQLAEAYYRGRDFAAAAELASRLLEASPWAANLRQLRAECYIALVSYLLTRTMALIIERTQLIIKYFLCSYCTYCS